MRVADPGSLGVVVSSGGLVRVNPGGIAVVVDVEGIAVMVTSRTVRTNHWPGRFSRDASRTGRVCIGGRFSGGSRCWRASSDVRSSMATRYGKRR